MQATQAHSALAIPHSWCHEYWWWLQQTLGEETASSA